MTDNDTLSTIRYRLKHHRAKAEFALNEARKQCEVATRESMRVMELEEMLRVAVMHSHGQTRKGFTASDRENAAEIRNAIDGFDVTEALKK